MAVQQIREEICVRYWKPLYVYARAKGQSAERAEDLVQGFLARLLDDNRFLNADPKTGKFRSYLLSAFQRFTIDEWKRETAEKRGGGQQTLPLDFEAAEREISTQSFDRDPEAEFDRLWAKTIINQSLQQLEESWGKGERRKWFEELKPFLTLDPEESLAQIAERLGRKPGTVRMTLNRLREDYRVTIRQTVAETLPPGADLDEEIQYLVSLLLRG